MNTRVLAWTLTALLLPVTAVAHSSKSPDCSFSSDFDLRLQADLLELRREQGHPQNIRLAKGQLWIDGQRYSPSAADARRLQQIEREVRELMPEIKAIALEGVAIAGEALSRVATVLSGDDAARLVAKVDNLQREFSEQIDRHLADGSWNSERFETEIERVVADLAPAIAGEIAAVAVRAALSGDTDLANTIEQRSRELEATLEREIGQRGKALERRAQALCPRVRRIDALESELELRLHDGSALDLVRI